MPARRNTQSRRLTTAGLIAVSAATLLMMAWAIFPTPAFANGTHVWGVDDNKQGSNLLPCENGGHWNFQYTGTVSSATLHVGSEDVAMSPQGGHFTADTTGPVTSGTSVSVTWVGSGEGTLLALSHCLEGSTTTTTTTQTHTTTTTTPPETTTTTTPVTTTTTTQSPTVSPTSITSTTTRTTTTTPVVAPTTVRPSGTAFTGFDNVVPLGAIALLLMTGGSALLWAGARRNRETG
jgi:hypothetical protein